ncbi:methyltransferase domain-containing protein [Telmatospirillum sp.]|uniref:class I SAM-dependent methyltransferase n=1 Tax=Telmatospirillum sp. TaxID=2079197 RepID=UPI002841FA21|nr:methyltransferase domain-containing protein [Telmatospirillum sp.]MDR3435152.1 methyltransferase domain-containing protein [Telmatospirillum sp.]
MDSDFWDSRFSSEDYIYGLEPNAHLVSAARYLKPGSRILVPGDGEGRNGVWLAGRGMDVLSVDGSPAGLAKARKLAQSRGVTIATQQADLLNWQWPIAAFDAVVSIFLHFVPDDRKKIHAAMVSALRSGGILIFEVFAPEQLAFSSGGPKDLALLCRADDLRADFASLEILALDEAEVVLDEGSFHQGKAAVVRMVARKP